MCSSHKVLRCNKKDRTTLLTFKQGVTDNFSRLSSWSTQQDCCAWEGVHCHNITGRVTKLHLQPPYPYSSNLAGECNLSLLLGLEFLQFLDLSGNDFHAITTHDNFTASTLHYLDIGYQYHTNHIDNLQWLSRLSSIKYLDLTLIDLHKETNWLQLLAMLPSLSELHLSSCKLNILPSLNYVNLTSLKTLDLSDNNFNNELPKWLLNLSDISHLDLSNNQLKGSIPQGIGQLKHLQFLDLSYNQFKGSIPEGIGQLEHLQLLDLSDNMLWGIIPSTLGNLSSLVTMKIGSNSFSGAISETTFSKLSNLKVLNLSNSTFAFHLDPTWSPPFQLRTLYLGYTNLGPNLPEWIYTQKSLQYLETYKALEFHYLMEISLGELYKTLRLSGFIPQCVYNITEMVELVIPNNGIYGEYEIDVFTKGHDYEISFDLLHRTIDLSVNNLSGEIPSSLYGLILVHTLNLSYNHLTGTIHKKIGGMKTLESLDLSNNKLIGEIPASMAAMSFIDYLNLSYNNFSGQIPISTQLQSFDASSYIGNPELCGAPLRNCTTKEENGKHIDMDARNEEKRETFYVGMGVGFAVAFWGTCGSLLLIRRWKHTYYRLLDQLWDQLYVTFMEAADYVGLWGKTRIGCNLKNKEIIMAANELRVPFSY
ncbi:hypothetical protein RJT34_00356 [Clitoria ternatea]|uniref:Leucine-rich repeat-containing N-terminal plant-type domain-containing protein n=1 Tax=Clitoria ternatea TaxID=43366 RepID=A0AAN9PXZ9_CLITE